MPPLIILIPVIGLLYLLLNNFYLKRRVLPPGPSPLPLLGNAVSLMNAKGGVVQKLCQWSKEYGGIFTIWLGPKALVLIDDIDIAKEEMVKNGDLYTRRPTIPLAEKKFNGMNGIVMSSGAKWQENRRFALRIFRDFGVGKPLMEQQIESEIAEMITHLEGQCGADIKLTPAFDVCVSNIISRLLWDMRNEYDSESFHELKDIVDEHLKAVLHPAVLATQEYPWLANFPYFRPVLQNIDEHLELFLSYIRKRIEEHVEKFDPSAEPNDFTNAYLKEVHRRGKDDDIFGKRQLEFVCLDLWFAGLETTVTTLQWAFLYMVTHPRVQEKVQDEIDRLELPQHQQVSMQDRQSLVYTQAVINEAQRLGNIIPINLMREVRQPTVVGPYTLPAGTAVIASIGTLMMNENLWKNATSFDPQRHLSTDGLSLLKHDALLPFSLGKRSCMGEAMARMELFLIFANLMKNYSLQKAANEPYNMTPGFGLTSCPKPYLVGLVNRFKKNANGTIS